MTTSSSAVRDDILARRMFFLGLALLPWLWMVNILYFWDDVYGPCPWLLGCNNRVSSSSPPTGDDEEEEPSSSTSLTTNGIGGEGVSANPRNSESIHNGPDEIISREEIAKRVSKWVKRSTLGSFTMSLALVAWITVIQMNRDNFGPKWFVIPLTDAERTGW